MTNQSFHSRARANVAFALELVVIPVCIAALTAVFVACTYGFVSQ